MYAKARSLWGALILLLVIALAVVHAAASDDPSHLARALAAQEILLAERPGDAQVHNDLGNLLALTGREREAESAYRRALELDPAFVPARFNLALLLHQRGDDNDAAVEYFYILELEPNHAWAHYQLGVIAEKASERKKAIEHYARAFALDSQLSFAEVNPHIIDNGLMTQALLRTDRYTARAGAQVPRQYGDIGRIMNLMLAEPEAEAEDVPEPTTESPIGVDRGVPIRDEGIDDEDSDGVPRTLTTRDLQEDAAGGRPTAGRTPTRRSPGQLLERYRPRQTPPPPGATAGQPATGGGTAVTPPTRTAPVGVVPVAPPTTAVPPPPGGSRDIDPRTGRPPRPPRFVPGERSTGNLELELLPPVERAVRAG